MVYTSHGKIEGRWIQIPMVNQLSLSRDTTTGGYPYTRPGYD